MTPLHLILNVKRSPNGNKPRAMKTLTDPAALILPAFQGLHIKDNKKRFMKLIT